MKTMMKEISRETIETNSRGNNKMKKFTKILKNQKGLTLIELLAVIVILAIVAAIAVPAIGNVINSSRDKAILSEASNIIAGTKLAALDNACDPTAATSDCTSTNSKVLPYLEGIPAGATFKVSKNATTGVYSIIYTRFSELKVTENKAVIPALATTSATDSQINGLLK